MRTIAIVNEKGGTGKTTTSVNLAAALGTLGNKILLVDLDGQAAASRWLGVEGDTRLADALWSGTGLEPIAQVAPNVDLAPAHGKLDIVAHDLRPTQGGQLRKVLSEHQGKYDFCLIDCPPSLGNRLIGNALLASDSAIVPVETSVLPLDGLKILLTTLDDVREGFGHHIHLAGVVAVRYDGRTRLSRLILEELQRALPGKVFKTVIHETVRMRECPAASEPIITYDPNGSGARDYKALAQEFLDAEARGWDHTHWAQVAEEYAAADNDHWKEIAARLKGGVRKSKGDDEDNTEPADPQQSAESDAQAKPTETPAPQPEPEPKAQEPAPESAPAETPAPPVAQAAPPVEQTPAEEIPTDQPPQPEPVPMDKAPEPEPLTEAPQPQPVPVDPTPESQPDPAAASQAEEAVEAPPTQADAVAEPAQADLEQTLEAEILPTMDVRQAPPPARPDKSSAPAGQPKWRKTQAPGGGKKNPLDQTMQVWPLPEDVDRANQQTTQPGAAEVEPMSDEELDELDETGQSPAWKRLLRKMSGR